MSIATYARTKAQFGPSPALLPARSRLVQRKRGLATQLKPINAYSLREQSFGYDLDSATPGIHIPLSIPSVPIFSSSKDFVQLRADTTFPVGTFEELKEPMAAEVGQSEEIPDTGQGVADIEAEMPFGTVDANKEGETPMPSPVQTKPGTSSASKSAVNGAVSSRTVLSSLGRGTRLNPPMRTKLERFFGQDFGGVRLHTGSRSRAVTASLGAQAFAIRNHIAFAGGRYDPASTTGRRLIAHELAHVVQQRRGMSGRIIQEGIGCPGDFYEQEADRWAQMFVQQEGAHIESTEGGPLRQTGSVQKTLYPVMQFFSGSKAAAYAKKWAYSTNKKYGRFPNNDCTNFVSQAMKAGGWSMKVGRGYCKSRKSDSVWWFRKGGCQYRVCPLLTPYIKWCPTVRSIHASYTWGGAANFYRFTKKSGRGKPVKWFRDLKIGDVLQIKMKGKPRINHSMVVTKKTRKNLFFSYHTNDHKDEPFYPDGSNKGIKKRNPGAKWYGWNMT